MEQDFSGTQWTGWVETVGKYQQACTLTSVCVVAGQRVQPSQHRLGCEATHVETHLWALPTNSSSVRSHKPVLQEDSWVVLVVATASSCSICAEPLFRQPVTL